MTGFCAIWYFIIIAKFYVNSKKVENNKIHIKYQTICIYPNKKIKIVKTIDCKKTSLIVMSSNTINNTSIK